MKLLFVCGCLEEGRDGVGDYTKLLAENLVSNWGVEITIVAINDTFVSENKEFSHYNLEGLNYLRIPSHHKEYVRFEYFTKTFDNFKPDWLSLQFVPYSFHSKGLPVLFAYYLKRVIKDKVKVHLMVHELWVGMARQSSFKLKILGKFQRSMISNILKVLKPDKIQTHCNLYRKEISQMGYDSNILPLFSNIRKIEGNKTVIENLDLNNLNIVLFGNIHPGVPVKKFIESSLEEFPNFTLHFVGGNGSELDNWKKVLDSYNVQYIIHGRNSQAYVSALLSNANLGVSTTPYYVSQKSGSVAAMLYHSLPVICVSTEWTPYILERENATKVELKNSDVFNWNFNFDGFDRNKIPNGGKYNVANIALKFYENLN